MNDLNLFFITLTFNIWRLFVQSSERTAKEGLFLRENSTVTISRTNKNPSAYDEAT